MMWFHLSLLLVACLHYKYVVCHTVSDANSPSHDHGHFSYDPDPQNTYGILNWGKAFTGQCAGSHQSPVDIQTDSVRYQPKLACPVFVSTAQNVRGHFKNNGHAPEFIPLREDDLVVSNVPYRLGDYRLQGFHIHYGGDIGGENAGVRTSHGGSEHAVNGARFDGELHVVLINRKYQDIRDAETRTDGLVVLVFFIKTAPSTTDPRAAEFSQFLETNIPVIANHDVNVSVAINLGMFLDRQCDFYTYAGSLTTPLCHESVRWVIFQEPLTVTETAWQTLAGLQGHGAHGNCRGIQPLNDRLIKANFQPQRTTTTQAPVRERVRSTRRWMMNRRDTTVTTGSPFFTDPGLTMGPWTNTDPAMDYHENTRALNDGYQTQTRRRNGGQGFRRGRRHWARNQAADIEHSELPPRYQQYEMLLDMLR